MLYSWDNLRDHLSRTSRFVAQDRRLFLPLLRLRLQIDRFLLLSVQLVTLHTTERLRACWFIFCALKNDRKNESWVLWLTIGRVPRGDHAQSLASEGLPYSKSDAVDTKHPINKTSIYKWYHRGISNKIVNFGVFNWTLCDSGSHEIKASQ